VDPNITFEMWVNPEPATVILTPPFVLADLADNAVTDGVGVEAPARVTLIPATANPAIRARPVTPRRRVDNLLIRPTSEDSDSSTLGC
jgi:hypothetical protein